MQVLLGRNTHTGSFWYRLEPGRVWSRAGPGRVWSQFQERGSNAQHAAPSRAQVAAQGKRYQTGRRMHSRGYLCSSLQQGRHSWTTGAPAAQQPAR